MQSWIATLTSFASGKTVLKVARRAAY